MMSQLLNELLATQTQWHHVRVGPAIRWCFEKKKEACCDLTSHISRPPSPPRIFFFFLFCISWFFGQRGSFVCIHHHLSRTRAVGAIARASFCVSTFDKSDGVRQRAHVVADEQRVAAWNGAPAVPAKVFTVPREPAVLAASWSTAWRDVGQMGAV